MKKIVALLLALSMVFALCGCGNNSSASGEEYEKILAENERLKEQLSQYSSQAETPSDTTNQTSSSSSIKTSGNQYLLGTPVQEECERGTVSVSLDSVSVKNNCITIETTNHGDVGMGNQSYMWTVIYYDSDGYAINKGYISPNNQTEAFKPNKTITLSEDFSYRLANNPDLSYISIEYIGFQSQNNNFYDIHLMYHYAVDLDGNQIDYSMLTQ